MGITNLELKFSKVGVTDTVSNQSRKVRYIPVVVVQFENQPKKKRIYLEGFIFDKKSVKHVIAGETYIALLVNEVFFIYDLEGRKQGTVFANDYGELIQINEDSFILCKDRVITWVNDKGKIVNSRELTDEEYQSLHVERESLISKESNEDNRKP